MTTAVNSTSQPGYVAQPKTAEERASQNYNDFLTLLTTQLKNQDPTEPADTNQLTQQIATLSQVEQQIATNKSLSNLLDAYNSTQISSAVSYIGTQIDAKGDKLELVGEQGVLAYNLPKEAKTVKITITDTKGATVFTSDYNSEGPIEAGRNQVVWNGTDQYGNKMPAGTYKFKVSAKDDAGQAIKATTLTTGVVTSLDIEGGVGQLAIGTLRVPLKDVSSVHGIFS